MADLNNPGPDDIAEARELLRRADYDEPRMSDAETVQAMRDYLPKNVVAPPRRAGHGPINARAFFTDHLTGGGTALPAAFRLRTCAAARQFWTRLRATWASRIAAQVLTSCLKHGAS